MHHLTVPRIVSSRTSKDVERLSDRFRTQEDALVDLGMQLQNRQISPRRLENEPETKDPAENERSNQLAMTVQEVCQNILSVTKAKRTGQTFGDMLSDDHSVAMCRG